MTTSPTHNRNQSSAPEACTVSNILGGKILRARRTAGSTSHSSVYAGPARRFHNYAWQVVSFSRRLGLCRDLMCRPRLARRYVPCVLKNRRSPRGHRQLIVPPSASLVALLEGILAFRSLPLGRAENKIFHNACMFTAAVLVSLGLYAVFQVRKVPTCCHGGG